LRLKWLNFVRVVVWNLGGKVKWGSVSLSVYLQQSGCGAGEVPEVT
jgi:hypothetical protein